MIVQVRPGLLFPPPNRVMLGVAVSVAVIHSVPGVLKMAENVWVPASAAVKVYPAGKDAWGSLLVNCTVPMYPLMMLP